MSDADTIRRDAHRIIKQPQMPNGGSENGDEAWYWTHEHLAGFARGTLDLLAENERLREALERIADGRCEGAFGEVFVARAALAAVQEERE